MQLNEAIQQIKQKTDIVEIVNRYVQLKKIGRNYRGLCPFHPEKTPSFFVNPTLGIYKCFGCQAGGDVIKFIQEIEQISFIDSVKKLAKELGLNIDELTHSKTNSLLYKRYYKINKIFAEAYHKALFTPKGQGAFNYLIDKRKISTDTIKTYKIGYAPFNLEFINIIAKHFNISQKELQLLGFINEKNKPRFINRVMFPILDVKGNIVGFSGRTLSKKSDIPKYLNTPETPLFHKREILFNLYYAKRFIIQYQNIILTEGQIDTITAYERNIKNVVAPLGTALTDLQLASLKRLTKRITFAYDNDSAGQKALLRSTAMALLQDFVPHVLLIPNKYKDLDEYITSEQISDLGQLQAKDVFQFYTEQLNVLKQTDYATYEDLLDNVLTLITLANPIRQDALLQLLSKKIHLNINTLKRRLHEIRQDPQKRSSIMSFIPTPNLDQDFNEQTDASSSTPNYRLITQLLHIFSGILVKYPIYWLYIPNPSIIVKLLYTQVNYLDTKPISLIQLIHEFWKIHVNKLPRNKKLTLETLQNLFDEKLAEAFTSSLHHKLEEDSDLNEFVMELSTAPLFEKYTLSLTTLKEVKTIIRRILRPIITQQLKNLLQNTPSPEKTQTIKKYNELLQKIETHSNI